MSSLTIAHVNYTVQYTTTKMTSQLTATLHTGVYLCSSTCVKKNNKSFTGQIKQYNIHGRQMITLWVILSSITNKEHRLYGAKLMKISEATHTEIPYT